MTIGMENITYNQTANTTIADLEGSIGDLFGQFFGGYEIIGIVLLAAMAYGLYKTRVKFDTGAVFMSVAIFTFASFGLLPGGEGSLYGLVLGIAGLISAGLYRYFGR